MEDLAKEIAEKAITKQLEIMEEQQQRAQEFVDSKVNESFPLSGLLFERCEPKRAALKGFSHGIYQIFEQPKLIFVSQEGKK